jgi:micrococcal nuclease
MKHLLIFAAFVTLSFGAPNTCETYDAHVESVYDGDTVTCDIEIGFDIVLDDAKIRVARIDAPEVRGDEKVEGYKSRDALRALIDGKDVEIVYLGKGKYGRIVAEIIIDGTNVSDWLVKNGYAEYRDY